MAEASISTQASLASLHLIKLMAAGNRPGDEFAAVLGDFIEQNRERAGGSEEAIGYVLAAMASWASLAYSSLLSYRSGHEVVGPELVAALEEQEHVFLLESEREHD